MHFNQICLRSSYGERKKRLGNAKSPRVAGSWPVAGGTPRAATVKAVSIDFQVELGGEDHFSKLAEKMNLSVLRSN